MSLKVLKEELDFYNQKKDELLRTHPGQFVLIKGRELLGVFATREGAYVEGVQRFGRECFLVHRIVEIEPIEQVPLIAHSLCADSLVDSRSCNYASRRMRPATARTFRGAASQMARAESALQPMASQKAGV